jgi:hypothetical protein
MGTRGCFGVRIDGQDKLTYNHWDSYPDGLGASLVDQLRQMIADGVDMAGLARSVRLIDESEPASQEDQERFGPNADLGVSKQDISDWYCLLRPYQGNLSALLQAGVMSNARSFMADSLFCEWAYVVNLDERQFEVYEGFQNTQHSAGRYSAMPTEHDGYYPVALVASFPLDQIPENWIAELPRESDD